MNLNSFALHLSFHSEPEPPIKLERMEETTNKISLALEIPEEVTKIKSGGCSFQCTISFILRNSNSLQILLWVCKLYFAIRIAASWSRNSQSVKVKLQDTHHYSHIIIRYYMLKFYFLLYIFYTFKPIILFYSIRVFFFLNTEVVERYNNELCVVKWCFCFVESQRDCRTQPCQNGGTCIQSGDIFSCECLTSFKGRQCELCKSKQQVTLYHTLSFSGSRNTQDTFRSMSDIFC